MAPALRLLLVVVIAGSAAFGLTRYFSAPPPTSINEVEWLTNEFNLNAEQSQQIAALHTAYQPICADHCAAILTAQDRIDAAVNDTDLETAEAALRMLEQTCHESTQAHLQAVAAVMDPAQGKRYLALISPRLSNHEHAEPFGLK